jgi:L-glutamine:2-deoxy-scyllo-inosose/3-amino-2,3-dideoxy-scyllo-inosose aminotransferase
MNTLALLGGSPVGRFETPPWPQPRPETVEAVRAVLYSGRWALSGTWQGGPSAEARFAANFARYNGVPFCVPTANGTSALVIALEALDVGTGDEVIIPGLTWVANATTVLAVNATPVMVDIDPATLCLSPAAVEAAITPRTRAIVVVHLYSSLADLDAILAIGERHGIPVIEDCAQAHGARWRDRRVGGWGAIGTFSMQQTKLLTAGEGGAAICSDPELYDRLYQLRSDGRRAVANPARGEMELGLDSSIAGSNYCLSELAAAVLDEQLTVLDDQHRRRARTAEAVDKLLSGVDGVQLVEAAPQVTHRTYYYYTFRIDPQAFADVSASTVCRALSAETGLTFQPTYPPLYRHPLYQPHTKRRFRLPGTDARRLDGPAGGLPETERAHREVITFHHSALLADEHAFDHLPEAIEKLQRAPDELRRIAQEDPGFHNPL